MFHEEFKRYWKKVEQNLTCSRVSRKKFYRQTLEAADRFLAEQPEVNFAQVEEFLGSPQELAQSYLDTLPLKEISTFPSIKDVSISLSLSCSPSGQLS